jgi:uncharacterized protein
MPTRQTAPIGAPCWVDLRTSDTERSRTFYRELFGWAATDPAPEFGGYFNYTKDGVMVAGCMANQPPPGAGGPESEPQPDGWSVYLATDDAAKTLDLAAAGGGQVQVPTMVVGDLGTMAVVADPGGASIGVWQPDTFQGIGVLGEPGTPSWFELHTTDYPAAVAFYRDVFRWDTHVMGDSSEFRYTTARDPSGEGWLAGIMDASGSQHGTPAGWTVYFGVADADAALARIVELGGTIVTAAEDTPYGRLAAATDATGAAFKLAGPNVAAST